MARIRIEDLSALENLTPEEQEQLLGAGRPSFHPTFEALEGREMYAANITAGVTAGVLHVRTIHAAGTPQNDAVAFSMVKNQLQVLNEARQVVKSFTPAETAQIKAIDVVMEGRDNHLSLDLTGLGKMNSAARHITLGEGDSADVKYTNSRGQQVLEKSREYDQDGRHTKETILSNGDKVVEQSWQAGAKTLHFVTVDNAKGRLVTGEDNGDGFLVTTQIPGVAGSEVKTKFDSYGGTWNGESWVPQVGQKLVERAGQAVNGEWKDGRWVVTTTQGDRTHVQTYEGYGKNGVGANLVLDYKDGNWGTFQQRVEQYEGGVLTERLTLNNDGKTVIFGERQGDGTWKETRGTVNDAGGFVAATGVASRIEVFDKADGKLLSRTTETPAAHVVENFDRADGKLLSRRTEFKSGPWTVQYAELRADGKWVITTTGAAANPVLKGVDVTDRLDGDRTLYRRDTYYRDGRLVHGEGQLNEKTNQGPWAVATYTSGGFQLQADGTVRVNTADGYKVYQRVGNVWKLVQYNHQITINRYRSIGTTREGGFIGCLPGQNNLTSDNYMVTMFVEESWAADGTYTQDLWTKQAHGGDDSPDHFARTVIKDGIATTTYFREPSVNYSSSSIRWGQDDHSRVTVVYNVSATGAPGELISYEVVPSYAGERFTNKWTKKDGWNVAEPWGGWDKFIGHAMEAKFFAPSWSVNPAAQETVSVPPLVTIENGMRDGKYFERIWNTDRTQSITYVYSGQDKKEMLGQTFGEMKNGKWVETTTHSKDFITRTETFDKVGGTLLSRETTRLAANNSQVTFHGEMKGGKWVETANDYLSFRSVTVEYDQPYGHAVKRYGQLRDGRFAVDTFDGSGRQVVQRDIFDKQGGTLKETWKGSDNDLTITRYNPTADVKQDELHYGIVQTDSGPSFVLRGYRASFNKPQHVTFTVGSRGGEDRTKDFDITDYHWSYSTRHVNTGTRQDPDWSWQDNYREGSDSAGTGSCNADSSPQFGPGSSFDIGQQPIWNKV